MVVRWMAAMYPCNSSFASFISTTDKTVHKGSWHTGIATDYLATWHGWAETRHLAMMWLNLQTTPGWDTCPPCSTANSSHGKRLCVVTFVWQRTCSVDVINWNALKNRSHQGCIQGNLLKWFAGVTGNLRLTTKPICWKLASYIPTRLWLAHPYCLSMCWGVALITWLPDATMAGPVAETSSWPCWACHASRSRFNTSVVAKATISVFSGT